MVLALALAVALAQAPGSSTATGGAGAFPPGSGSQSTINLVQWDANSLPRVYERSDQLPITDAEVKKLAQAGFGSAELVKMIEERRCACDASPDGLITLRQAHVPKEVISAVSLHSLRANRALDLEVTLDFTGESRTARDAYLYFFIDDGDTTRVVTANLNDLLGRPMSHETTVDNSNILIAKTVRRIVLPGQVPLKSYGRHTVLVAASASPTLTHPAQLKPNERANAQSYTLDYPRASLQSLCRLTAGYMRDAVLTDRWRFVGSRFECEWN